MPSGPRLYAVALAAAFVIATLASPVAIGAGTAVAVETGDVVLMKSDPADVLAAIKLSRATVRKMKQNLFWAAIYNVVAMPITAGVLYPGLGVMLQPEFGALAMSTSSITVVSTALLLRSAARRRLCCVTGTQDAQGLAELTSVLERSLRARGLRTRWETATHSALSAGLLTSFSKGFAGFPDQPNQEHERCYVLSPPPSEERVQRQAE